MKILIADDSELFRERVKSLVKSVSGAVAIVESDNGIDALDKIIELEPVITILDIRMPLMNGIEVLQRVSDLQLKTKIFVMTNYPYKQYKEKCFEKGADYFFNKSEDFGKIKNVIELILKENNTLGNEKK